MIPTRLILAAALTLTAAPASAFCLCLKCASAEWETFQAASGSMKPTIEPDACLIVQHDAETKRGDIIAFRHPTRPDTTMIFRLIGLPGDTIAITNGQVILNGTALPQTPAPTYTQHMQPEADIGLAPRCLAPADSAEPCLIPRFAETLPDGTSYDNLDLKPDGAGDFMAEIKVPPGQVFVLGDNRDNAMDSRYAREIGGPGLIPIENILGAVVEITNP